LLTPDPKKRLNADEALQHEWIVLRGDDGGNGGDLSAARALLKQQIAQKRLTALWHVLDIVNALGAQTPDKLGKSPRSRTMLPPALLKRASKGSASGFGGESTSPHATGGARHGRSRKASTTDRVEELQMLFNLFDTDGNGTIDQDEIAALFKKLGFEPDPERLRKLLMRVDNNANGTLEFGEFCEFLRLAKESDGGLGIDTAVTSSLGDLAGQDGAMSNDALESYVRAFAENTGQPISQEDIDDIIALGMDDGEGGMVNMAGISHAMMLDPKQRHQEAMQRRTDKIPSAPGAAPGGQDEAAYMSGAI